MLTVVGMDQAGHQIHERRLARAVRADQARDARRNVQRDPVHAEHLAVELRDLVEDHCRPRPGRPRHDTTSTGRSLRSITTTSSRIITASAHADAPAPGP